LKLRRSPATLRFDWRDDCIKARSSSSDLLHGGGSLVNKLIRQLDDVIVVDASLSDYELLASDERLGAMTWRHFTTGEEALRGADASLDALWLVNIRLPDMDGAGFLAMLRRRSRRRPVFLVSDEYSLDDEVAARVAGASAYLWKPADGHWLILCRHATSQAATRKGMPRALG
jgi:DNA-binding response OmpR family regulator